MAQITLKQLEAFVQVADLGSFRRAADRLNTTQPNISTRIAGLEAQLGVTLMARDAGSVRLSPMGASLLPKARAALRAVEDLLVAAEDAHLFEGVLRLGVTEMPVHSWLGRYLAALKRRFPKIEVDLTVDYSANLSEALFARSIDLALQSGPFDRRISGEVALGSFPLAWVAAPALGLGARQLTLADLTAGPILTHGRSTLPYEQLSAHLGDNPGLRARLVPSTNMAACIQMTIEGLGVACLPAAMVAAEIAEGRLMALDYAWRPDALRFAARYEAETAPHYVEEAAVLAQQVAQEVVQNKENVSL
jgi:DNA-binding transcriptional LysR family regulator